jgi:pilus assembly protein FimV
MAGAKEYGPIKQGENLSLIAKSVAPEGVTLEQMMVSLYRSNPEAFINKNLNLVKAGRILRVPEKDEVAAIAPAEARKEFRAQVADWNAYRQNLAGSPGTARAEGRTTATGRITTKVEDKAGGEPKDVVRLSKGAPAGDEKGKARSTADRVRALEEEVLARDKALSEANERISQLEKTIKDMQRLAELKSPGMAAAQQKAEQAAKAKAEAQPTPPTPAPKPEVKAEAPKPEPTPAPKPEAKAEAPKPEPTPAPKPDAVAAVTPEAEKAAPAPDPAKAEAPKAAEVKPEPKPKPKAAPPPPPPPSMMDQIIEAATDPLYLGAGGGLIALGGLAFWMARRRRSADTVEPETKAAPVLGRTPAAAAADTTMTMPAAVVAAATAAPAAAASIDEVDPLAEAEVYIAYGRDAQAEEILKEALAKNPRREDAQLKLLEIYSARKDKDSFNKVATELNKQTGGAGENWLAAAAMGYALDPNNPLYEAGKHAAPAAAAAAAGTSSDLDFDLGGDNTVGAATDITLDAGATQQLAHDSTAVLDASELRSMAAEAQKEAEATAAPLMPDFSLDIPAAAGQDPAVTQTDIALDAVPTQDGHLIDFQIELPKEDAPETIAPPTVAEVPPTDGGLDFKLDIPDLNLGEKPGAAPETLGGGEKDGHWYDVQTKFDLAKAYQEMGDKDGAKEILQEVIKEGDTEQQSQAKKLLETLA